MGYLQKPNEIICDVDVLLQKAAEGDVEAKFNLGLIYVRCIGVKQDLLLAAKWLREAADQGHIPAARQIVAMAGNEIFQHNDKALQDFYAELRRPSQHELKIISENKPKEPS